MSSHHLENIAATWRRRRRACVFAASAIAATGFAAALWRPIAAGPRNRLGIKTAPVMTSAGELASARMSVRTWHHDFGSVAPSEKVSHRFEVTNSGRRDLIVAVLDKSCGCTSAWFENENIPPGASGFLEIEFDAPDHPGRVAHYVTVESNDPDRELARFTFAAHAEWAVEAYPAHVYAGVLMPGKAAVHDVELVSMTGEPFDVSRIETSAEWLKVERVREVDARRRIFRLTASRPEETGRFGGKIVFHTTSRKRPEISVEVRGESATVGALWPPSFALGSRPAGAEAEVNVTIRTRGKDAAVQDVAVRGSVWELRGWDARPVSADTARITTRVRVPDKLGRQKTTLVFSIEGEPEPLEAPISCLVGTAPEAVMQIRSENN